MIKELKKRPGPNKGLYTHNNNDSIQINSTLNLDVNMKEHKCDMAADLLVLSLLAEPHLVYVSLAAVY
jgi:hypothetical protein